MPERSNPVAYNVLGELTLTSEQYTDERAAISRIIQDGLSWDRNREGWLVNQRALTKLRYGIRKPKVFPWKGASNLSIPLTDQIIRKFKPMLMRLVVEPDPVVEFVGADPQAVAVERLAETVYNWLFKTEMNALEPMAYIIDTLCHRGFAFAQVDWDYQTEYEVRTVPVKSLFPPPPTQPGAPPPPPPPPEAIAQVLIDQYALDPKDRRVTRALAQAVTQIQKGAEFVKLAFRRVIADRPRIRDVDPVQVIAPPRTTDYPNAEKIIIQHLVPHRWVQQKEADGFFLPGTADAIKKDFAKSDAGRQLGGPDAVYSPSLHAERYIEDERERLWGKEDDENILLWQVYHWHDIDGDGLLDRVETWIHPRSALKCCSKPYAYPFHRWPLVKFDFEKTTRRWHSPRGISQLTRDLQKEVNAQHNGRIDGMTLRNSPIYQAPIVGSFQARNFRAVPGTLLRLPMGQQITPLVQDRGAYPEMVNEENMLRSIAENYVGVFDAAISSPQSQTNARTATEIQAVMQYTAATSTFDAILFQMSMRELHTLVWELWLDLGPPEVSIKVLGDDPTTTEPILQAVKKSEIARRFQLMPTGTVANTNRALELAHAKEALGLFINDQSGLINRYELYRWYLNLLDYRFSRRILNAQNQAMELQVLQRAAAAAQNDPRVRAALGFDNQPAPTPPGANVPEMGNSAVT